MPTLNPNDSVNTGGFEDFARVDMISIPKALYDALCTVVKAVSERAEKKDALYGLEKDIEKAMGRLKPHSVIK